MNKEDFFYWIKEYLSDAKDGLTPKQVEYILDHIKDVEKPLDNQEDITGLPILHLSTN